MNFTDVPLLSILREKMSWLNTRQAVLAQNVANEDVPGYSVQDLKPLDFEAVLKDATPPGKVGLTVTNPMHLVPPEAASDPYVQIDSEGSGPHSSSAVSDEEEMMKVSDTQAQYQAAANLYAKSIQMMRTAIDR